MGEILIKPLLQAISILTFNKSMFDTLLIILIATFAAWYVQYHWKRRKLYALAAKRNGPITLPFVGNALYFIGSNFDILDSMMKMSDAYKSPVRIWLGQKLFFGIYKPQHLEVIMNSPHALDKDELKKFTEVIISTGLLNASVPKWRRHRKIIMPTFNQKILDGFVEVFTEKSEILVKQLKQVAGKGTFDIFDYLSRCTLDIICETAMGVPVNAQTTNFNFVEWANRAMEIAFTRMCTVWYHYDFIFNRTSLSKEINDVTSKMRNFTGMIVKEKRIAFQNKLKDMKERPEALLEEEPKIQNTFLQKLMELSQGENFTDEELRQEVDTFMVAGSETTAATNSYILLMLGMFPEVQNRVYEEVIDVLGPEREIEYTDLGKFPYLERVIKETMRIFSVGPLITRAVSEDIKLDNCTIPRGCSVVLLLRKVHLDPEIWPNPKKFDPDRFLPEEVAKRHPYSWLPFSGGPRNCVGRRYAMMAMIVLIATAVRKYRFSTNYKSIEDIKVKIDITLKPVSGYKVAVELRE